MKTRNHENVFYKALNIGLGWDEEESLRVWNDFSALLSSKLIDGFSIDCDTLGSFSPVKHLEFFAQKREGGELFLMPPYIALEFYPSNEEKTHKVIKDAELVNLKQIGLLLINQSKISLQRASFFVDMVHQVGRELIDKQEDFELPGIGAIFFEKEGNKLFLRFEADRILASNINKPFSSFPISEVKNQRKLGSLDYVILENPQEFHPWNKVFIKDLTDSESPLSVGAEQEAERVSIEDEILKPSIEENTKEVQDKQSIVEVEIEEVYTHQEEEQKEVESEEIITRKSEEQPEKTRVPEDKIMKEEKVRPFAIPKKKRIRMARKEVLNHVNHQQRNLKIIGLVILSLAAYTAIRIMNK